MKRFFLPTAPYRFVGMGEYDKEWADESAFCISFTLLSLSLWITFLCG